MRPESTLFAKYPRRFFALLLFLLAIHAYPQDANDENLPAQAKVDSTGWQQRQQLLYQRLNAWGLNPGNELRVFGESLMSGVMPPATAAGHSLLPPEYVLGPGDEIGIFLLGNAPREFKQVILPEGVLYLPNAGLLSLVGKTLDEARRLVRNKMADYYDVSGFSMTLLAPKQVIVELTGEVRRPGRYAMSGLQTVLDAVLRAQGQLPGGSLRNLQVTQIDSERRQIDLYAVLLNRQKEQPVLLQPGDRIFVPPARQWVAISGEVLRPGIYELCESSPTTVADLIAFAGGMTSLADSTTLELSRLNEDGTRRLDDVGRSDRSTAGDPFGTVLRHGDRIHLYSKQERAYFRTVSIFGEVEQPGHYRFEQNMRASDLIRQAGGLKRAAYSLEAELARIAPGQPPAREKLILQSQGDFANGHTGLQHASEVLLQEDDQLFIRRIPQWQLGPVVEIRGEVRFPGTYALDWGTTRLSDLFALAGGVTPDAALRQIRLYRSMANQEAQAEQSREPRFTEGLGTAGLENIQMELSQEGISKVSVDFERLFAAGDSSQDVLLEPGDFVEVPRQSQLVIVTGAVGLPSGVPYRAGLKVKDYVERAGGQAPHADMRRTRVIRSQGEILADEEVEEVLPGDTIWVPSRRDRTGWHTFRDIITVAAQLATIYVVIDRAVN